MDLNRVYTWHMPAKLLFGPGCSRLAGDELKRLGGSKVLVVTDQGVEGAGVLGGILESVGAAGMRHAVYNGVEPNPSIRCVEEAAALYKAEACDCLLGVGGGSSMDTAKVAGVAITNNMDVRDMDGVNKFDQPIPPLVLIPTTCGTGSEVTPLAAVTDLERRFKMGMVSPLLFAKVALIDGALLTKLPANVIAGTGMDALCHALESYTGHNIQPVSEGLDLKAIAMISEWLRPAVAKASLEAMSHMVLASTIAGLGFGSTRVTAVHSMSHPVSSFFGVGHGVANAILLPHVMEFNLIGAPNRFADIARAMGEDTSGLTTMEAARLSVKAVRELSRDIGIPENLAAVGVTEELLPQMVEDTMKSGSLAFNPVRVTREDIARLYRRAMG